jgi:tetratricopeptide (TPR) repeat protein
LLIGATGQASDTEHIARWRELLELDLAQEVIADGLERIEQKQDSLAAEGEAVALMARALSQRGREARAAQLLEKAGVRESSAGHVVLERARLDLLDDELERAVERLADPSGQPRFAGLAESYLLLGRARMRQGLPERAEPLLKHFLESDPFSVEASSAWHMLAQAALARGDGAEAGRTTERARASGTWHAFYRARRLQVRAEPREPLPRLGLAQLWLQIDQPGRARVELLELLELAPGFCRAWEALGEAERKLAKLDTARAALTRALDCDPTASQSRYNRALLAKQLGDPAAARADLEIVVAGTDRADPTLANAHLELARLLSAAGEEHAAQARYQRYVELGGREPLRQGP